MTNRWLSIKNVVTLSFTFTLFTFDWHMTIYGHFNVMTIMDILMLRVSVREVAGWMLLLSITLLCPWEKN